MNDRDSASLINDTVQKAEIVSAIGREIDRIDRLSASNGYTNWALWGAIGVVGWKAIELLPDANRKEYLVTFLLVVVTFFTARIAMRAVASKPTSTRVYFRFANVEGSEIARVMAFLVVSLICLTIHVSYGAESGWKFYTPAIFLGVPMCLGAAMYFAPQMPVPRDSKWGPKGSVAWVLKSVVLGLVICGLCSIFAVSSLLDREVLFSPSAGVKIGLLAAVGTILMMRLQQNIETTERRTSFQRLETELTLAKVDVTEARERYENLMLGMNASAATRSFIDAVMIPLEEAHSNMSEAKQLLLKIGVSEESGREILESPLGLVVSERVKVLLANAESAVARSNKQYARLRGMVFVLFGERDIAKSPVSAENDKIVTAQKALAVAVGELRILLPR